MDSQGTDAALRKRAADCAAMMLERRGYKIVERDWRCEEGAFDVIASRDGRMVLAQVAAREGNTADFRDVGAPGRREQRASAARRYLDERGADGADARTEVIGVHILSGDRALLHRWADESAAPASRATRDDGPTR